MKRRYTLSDVLASKLASIVVHADEGTDPERSHSFDLHAIRSLVEDREVVAWIKSLGALAPLKRKP